MACYNTVDIVGTAAEEASDEVDEAEQAELSADAEEIGVEA
jgi:hypothetical protein